MKKTEFERETEKRLQQGVWNSSRKRSLGWQILRTHRVVGGEEVVLNYPYFLVRHKEKGEKGF